MDDRQRSLAGIYFDEKTLSKIKKERARLGIDPLPFPVPDNLICVPVGVKPEDHMLSLYTTPVDMIVVGYAKNDTCEAFKVEIFNPKDEKLKSKIETLTTIIPLGFGKELKPVEIRQAIATTKWNELIFRGIMPFTLSGKYDTENRHEHAIVKKPEGDKG